MSECSTIRVVPTVFDSKQKKSPASSVEKTAPVGQKHTQASLGPLACFALNPTNVRFETQEAEETVVLFLRQHIIVNVPWIVGAILLALVPPVFIPMALPALNIQFTLSFSYTLIITLFWYLAIFGFVIAKFLGWFFNIYIVTNERIIDIDFYYLLYKKFSQAELTRIQDISYATGGIIATMFNYGNVTVQTAGESPNIEFDQVPYPEQVVETIRNLTENTEKGGGV